MIGLLNVVGKVCVRGLRLLSAIVVSMALVVGSVLPAQAGGKFAAITVDARTGAVLFNDDANGLRHPASLTKMMTLYIVFQDLKAGRIRLSTPPQGFAPCSLYAAFQVGNETRFNHYS